MSNPFLDAIRAGDIDRVRSLAATDPEVVHASITQGEGPDGIGGGTGLHLAVAAGNFDMVRALLDLGADLEARNDDGRTALHDSIEYGKHDIRELLLERGAYVDICAAAILGLLGRVSELLDQEPGLANDRSTNLSPLGWAAFGNQTDTATELISRGARMDDGELLCAALVGHVEVGRLLLERGADPNEIDKNSGGTALHAAASMRYTDDSSAFVSMLLEAGADAGIRSTSGKTALQIAEEGSRRQARRGESGATGEFTRNYDGVAELLRRAEPLNL